MSATEHNSKRGLRRLIYSTRGVYLLIAQGVILALKHLAGSRVTVPVYIALLMVVIIGQIFRTWAAGFVGTVARGRDTYADTLLTAGPYSHVRNPMYLGIFGVTTALALMSGLWYGPLLAWIAYAFVYSNVIPYEEEYLRQRFDVEYEAYVWAVPRLIPAARAYPRQQGVFRLAEGLSNETVAWIGALVWAVLYWVL